MAGHLFYMKLFKTAKTFIKNLKGLTIEGGTDWIYKLGGGRSGKSVDQDPYSAMTGWVYRSVKMRSSAVALMNTHLFEMKPGGDVVEQFDHDMIALLEKPNPKQTKYDFLDLLEMYLCIWGEGPIHTEIFNGRIINLWPLRPDLLKAEVRDNEVAYFTYKVGQRTTRIPVEEIILIRDQNPKHPMKGLSPMLSISVEIDSDNSAAEWNKSMMENMAEPGFVLSTDSTLSDKQFKRVSKQWEARYQGPGNARKTAVLEEGLKPFKISETPKEMDWKGTREFYRDAILGMFGVPKALLVGDNEPRANLEGAEYVFSKYTVDSQMRLIVNQLNEFLVPKFGENLWLDYEDPVKEDRDRMRSDAASLTNIVFTPNEAREIYGLPPVQGGEYLYMPMALMPQIGPPDDSGYKDQKRSMEVIKLKSQSQSKDEKKTEEIKKKILARTRFKRKIAEKMYKRIEERIRKGIKDGKDKKIVLKMKGVKKKQDNWWEGLEGPAEHPVLVKDRKNYLEKRLPERQKQFRREMRKFFSKQEEEVIENLKKVGLPKARLKASVQSWIRKIVFDEKTQIGVLSQLSKGLLTENIQEGANDVASILGIDAPDITRRPFAVEYLLSRSDFVAQSVNDTTKQELYRTLAEGIEKGEGLDGLGNRVAGTYQEARSFRTEKIARTEVGSAQNFGRVEEMKEANVEKKVWVASFVNTREEHQAAHDQVVLADENFEVGGELLEHPGDISGSAGNVINCQCNVSPTLRDLT